MSEPVESWHSLLDGDRPGPVAAPPSPIGFAHNGFHGDDEQRFQPPSQFEASHELTDGETEQYPFRSNGRHSRVEPDDASSYGRHSRPGD